MIFWTAGGRLAHYALRSLSSRRCEMPDGATRPRLVDPALLAVRSRIRKPPFRFRQRSTFCSAPERFGPSRQADGICDRWGIGAGLAGSAGSLVAALQADD